MSRKRRTQDGLRKKVAGDSCVYCGLPRSCYDHFPPVASGTLAGWLLPACTECNSLLGAQCGFSFESRVEYIKSKLKRRLARHLRTPQWAPDEVAELGDGIRAAVAGWQAQRAEAASRLSWEPEVYLGSLGYEVAMSGRSLQRDLDADDREVQSSRETHAAPLQGPARSILEAFGW